MHSPKNCPALLPSHLPSLHPYWKGIGDCPTKKCGMHVTSRGRETVGPRRATGPGNEVRWPRKPGAPARSRGEAGKSKTFSCPRSSLPSGHRDQKKPHIVASAAAECGLRHPCIALCTLDAGVLGTTLSPMTPLEHPCGSAQRKPVPLSTFKWDIPYTSGLLQVGSGPVLAVLGPHFPASWLALSFGGLRTNK